MSDLSHSSADHEAEAHSARRTMARERLTVLSAQHGFTLLFFSLLAFLIVAAGVWEMRRHFPWATSPLAHEFGFAFLLAVAIATVRHTRHGKLWCLGIGVPAFGLGLAGVMLDVDELTILRHVLAAAFLGHVIGVLTRAIMASRQVSWNTVSAALCIYVLLGLAWVQAYVVLHAFNPEAFQPALPSAGADSDHLPRLLYFSYSTLTTLGYGDIVAVSPIARMLAVIEAIAGQLFLAVLIARLVGIQAAQSLSRDAG